MRTVGERLKWIRGKKGFTQQRVADALGMERSTYAKMESRKITRIDLSLIPALMNLYSLDEKFFLYGDDSPDTAIDLNADADAEEAERTEPYTVSEVLDAAHETGKWGSATEMMEFAAWAHPRINGGSLFFMDGGERRDFLRMRVKDERKLWEEGKKK